MEIVLEGGPFDGKYADVPDWLDQLILPVETPQTSAAHVRHDGAAYHRQVIIEFDDDTWIHVKPIDRNGRPIFKYAWKVFYQTS